MNLKTVKDKIGKKINKQSVKGFFKKQGLYVLIFLCLVAAGITALVAWPRDDINIEIGESGSSVLDLPDFTSEDTNVSNIGAPSLEDELRELDKGLTGGQPPFAVPTFNPEATNSSEAVVVSNGSGSIVLTQPVAGQIIAEFSGDSLVYFASLNVWATHNGIDIKAEKDAVVVAALSGTVQDVQTNEADGGVVVISHSNNSKTVYAGLTDITVATGDKINAGQQIGKIGDLPRELDLSYHLHFEYIVDEIYKNPAKYF